MFLKEDWVGRDASSSPSPSPSSSSWARSRCLPAGMTIFQGRASAYKAVRVDGLTMTEVVHCRLEILFMLGGWRACWLCGVRMSGVRR